VACRGDYSAPAAVNIRVLVVDDQTAIRAGFKMILDAEDDMEVVGEAGDGEEAIEQALVTAPDVILMDVRMPGMDGIEATRRLAATGAWKILILTTFGLDDYLFSSVRAGASGFLLKDVPPQDLINAVKVVARGDALVEPRMTKKLFAEFAKHRVAPAFVEAGDLTSREVEVMGAVARGLSNGEVADRLFITEATVKTHVAHILAKLNLRDRVQIVVFAYENGLASADA